MLLGFYPILTKSPHSTTHLKPDFKISIRIFSFYSEAVYSITIARNWFRFLLSTCFDDILANWDSILLMNEQNLWKQGNIEWCVLFTARIEANDIGGGMSSQEKPPFLQSETSLGVCLSLSSSIPFELKAGSLAKAHSLIRLPPINQKFTGYN